MIRATVTNHGDSVGGEDSTVESEDSDSDFAPSPKICSCPRLR